MCYLLYYSLRFRDELSKFVSIDTLIYLEHVYPTFKQRWV